MKVRWVLGSDLAELAEVSRRVIQIGKDHRLPDEVTADVRLALEEVLSNIIRHGSEGRADRRIDVQILVANGEITLEIQDEGVPFNPLEYPEPDVALPLEERGLGGLGILLVRRLMDGMAYRREQGRNILVLKKRMARPNAGGGDRGPS